MKITVLAENSVCKTNTLNVKTEHILSLFIEFDERIILFDTGQSDLFIQNAEKMGIALSQVDYLVISNGHYDHGGSLKQFLKINKKAKVFLHITAAHRFYTMISGSVPYYVGPDQKIIAQKNRIYFIDEDTQIEDKIILLEGFEELFPQPEAIIALFKKTHNRFITDKFNHELVMLLIENDEIVLFSGSLDSGIINTIEEVKLFSKNLRIKATFGSFHIKNPISINNESHEYSDKPTEVSGDTDPESYTGQCRGENNFRYVKGWMCRKMQTMNTGEVIEV